MGGVVGVESSVGEGSEFWFTATFGVLASLPDSPGPVCLEGVPVLIVDDDATNRAVLSAQLVAKGMEVTEAANAFDALGRLESSRDKGRPFGLAILDMNMPEMDGEALCKTIRAHGEHQDLPLMLMSSVARRGDAKKAREMGFSAYLPKPVSQSDLYDGIATVLGRLPSPSPQPLVTKHRLRELRHDDVRVLLVEDNFTNQQVAKGILEKLGCRADVAVNGLEAVEALTSQNYDLVFMDVQMPEMDGYEATRAIRSESSVTLNRDIPIVAMTAHAMRGDREKCLAVGMNDYITKPIDPDRVADTLAQWLSKPPTPIAEDDRELKVSSVGVDNSNVPSTVVFDHKALRRRLLNDDDLMREVLRGFLGDMGANITRLETSADALDFGAVREQAHKIRGAAANVGGMALSAAAYEVERAGEFGVVADINRVVATVRGQFKQFGVAAEEIIP